MPWEHLAPSRKALPDVREVHRGLRPPLQVPERVRRGTDVQGVVRVRHGSLPADGGVRLHRRGGSEGRPAALPHGAVEPVGVLRHRGRPGGAVVAAGALPLQPAGPARVLCRRGHHHPRVHQGPAPRLPEPPAAGLARARAQGRVLQLQRHAGRHRGGGSWRGLVLRHLPGRHRQGRGGVLRVRPVRQRERLPAVPPHGAGPGRPGHHLQGRLPAPPGRGPGQQGLPRLQLRLAPVLLLEQSRAEAREADPQRGGGRRGGPHGRQPEALLLRRGRRRPG
mmetsp:Transcript_39322/g.116511  ORF Transcript_39322/g.116511 Transcript_39322/m.116511 type:complete len:279 (-) Transcript_39322:174-1010(-)